MRKSGWVEAIVLAAVLTLLNAIKPAAVDDTAYLQMGKHLAAHPLDPYGFELFWYWKPDPAMHVLLPPVLPYWLAGSLRICGDHLFLVKLCLFPFAMLLAASLRFLLKRFSPEWDRPMLAILMLSGAILPTFGVMLDVPALALGLAAVACFVSGCDDRRIRWAWLAGLFLALAMQTKYSMLTIPAVIVWYGLLSRRILYAILAVSVAATVFAAWEYLLLRQYGESHFLFHLDDQPAMTWKEKFRLFQPMLGQLGGVGIGVGIVAAYAAGVNRWLLAIGTVIAAVGVGAVCVVPLSDAVLVPGKLDLSKAVFVTLGAASGLAVLAAAVRMLVRSRGWNSADSWFLVGWLLLEIVAYFALTSFPAARRVISLTVVGGLVAARMLSLGLQRNPDRRAPRWLVPVGFAAGLGLFAVECWDCFPEEVLAERAAERIGDPGSHTVWFNGHWGFQYYCDRAGMKPVVPSRSTLRTGDWLVFPAIPDDYGFYRPYHGGAKFLPDLDSLEPIDEFTWDDRLSAQTIPNFYGGIVPIAGRDHPRLRIVLYRVTQDWKPTYAE